MVENVCRRAINLSIPLAALFVMESASISEARQNQAVTNAIGSRAVLREPGDRSDRTGDEKEALGVA